MRILLTGASGMLGRAVSAELGRRGHGVLACDRAALDVTDRDAVDAVIHAERPEAVVCCSAYTRVDEAEREEDAAFRVNAAATDHLARACRRVGARFVYPSTDYVFDGTATMPYPPAARPNPLGAYGRSKLAGEACARLAGDWLIVRTSWLYGRGGQNFVAAILERARSGQPLRVVADQRGAPTWTGSLADALARLLEWNVPAGAYHVTNAGETTWHGLASEAVRLAGLDVPVEPCATADVPRPAARPAYSVLDCRATEALIGPVASWRAALADALREGV